MKIVLLCLSLLVSLSSFSQDAEKKKIEKTVISYLTALRQSNFTKARKLVDKNSLTRFDRMETAWQKMQPDEREKRNAYLRGKEYKIEKMQYGTGKLKQTIVFVQVELFDANSYAKSFTKAVMDMCVTDANGKWLIDLNEEMDIAPSLIR